MQKLTCTEDMASATNCTNDYCMSNEEYDQMIRDYQFPTNIEWGLISAYFLTLPSGVFGNAWALYLIWKRGDHKTSLNYFVLNICMIGLILFIGLLAPFLIQDVSETWYFGAIGCKVLESVRVCIALDRK